MICFNKQPRLGSAGSSEAKLRFLQRIELTQLSHKVSVSAEE